MIDVEQTRPEAGPFAFGRSARWRTSAAAVLLCILGPGGVTSALADRQRTSVMAAHASVAAAPVSPAVTDTPGHDLDCPPLLRHTFKSLRSGTPESLCRYQGHVLLIVNTASYCGFTSQYEGLEALYRKYKDRGLVVLGFPSNDFGAQEPGSNKEVAEFCRTTYGIEFPMFEKSSVTRLDGHPLYAELVARTGQAPRWNFHKYVVDRSGQRVQSFASEVTPDQRGLVGLIERLLAIPNPAPHLGRLP